MSARRSNGKDVDLGLIVETIIYLQSEGRRQAREQGAKVGLSPTQLNVVKLLGEIGELSLSELSRRLAAQNSTVTGIVDRMVEAGLVERRQSEKDRRVWQIRLSERGRQVSRKVRVAPWDWLHGALEALEPDEKAQLVGILEKVAAHVSKQVAREDDDGSRR
jgi:DNA-binding MarR family transcriptional regulator